MSEEPLSHPFETDRDSAGRFRPGHRLPGPGNPNLVAMNKHRAAMLAGVKDRDIQKAMRFLVKVIGDKSEKTSDRLTAANLLLNRILGTPTPSEALERLEALEARIGEKNHE